MQCKRVKCKRVHLFARNSPPHSYRPHKTRQLSRIYQARNDTGRARIRGKYGYAFAWYCMRINHAFSLYFSKNSLYYHFFVDTLPHFVDYYLRPVSPIRYLWVIIKRNKITHKMKNLTLPTQEQVNKEIEKYCLMNGAIDLNNFSHYLWYAKELIRFEFKLQGVEFNADDFLKMYILYTDNVLKCKVN